MKGISSLLIAALVVSAYGGSLGKSEWESLEKFGQENALSKEKLFSVLREIGKEPQTTSDKYTQFLTHSKNHEVENDDKNIDAWGPGIPPNIISRIKKYKQNLPKEDEACKKNQSKEKDDSDDTKDNEDSNKEDIDGENSDHNEDESPIKSRHRKSVSKKDKDSSDEDDDSNSIDDNSSDEKSRWSHRGKGKPKQMNFDENNSDEKSDDSNEKNSTVSRKDKRIKKNSDESNSDDKSDESDNDETKSGDSRKDKPKKNDSDESNSDDKSDESDNDETKSGDSRKDKPKKNDSDESNSDDKSDDNDSNKSKEDIDDNSKNSTDVNKWKWILNRGDHQAHKGIPAPSNWTSEYNWELEAMRGELKSRLIRMVQLERVIKSLKALTEEFNKIGQWERTPGLIKAIVLHKKLLGENILAVCRICNITEVELHQISELIINCTINYSLQWINLSNVERPILKNNKPTLNHNITLHEFLAAHPNLNQTNIILQLLKAKGLKDKAGEGKQQMNGTISWQSQADKSAPPSDITGANEQETSLNSANSSDNKNNGSVANESVVLDQNQAPEPIPTNPSSKDETDEGQDNENSDKEVRENSAGNNNQISTTADPPPEDTSSQADPTTSQSEQSSNNSENTDTKDPRSTSASSPEETTETIQNANSESESIFNTTAPNSTSLNKE